jgi:hypothetical protein
MLKALLYTANYIFAQVRLFSKSRRRSHGKNINYVFLYVLQAFWHDFRLYLWYDPVLYLSHNLIRLQCTNLTSKLCKCRWCSLTRIASDVIVVTINSRQMLYLQIQVSRRVYNQKKNTFFFVTFISGALSLTAHQ